MKNIIAKKDEELKGKTVEPENISTAERYDVSAHQQALIRHESSLQNREKALEARVMAEVEKKNRLIERMTAQFENSLVESHNKHELEINEYRKKEENMKNIIAKKDEELKGKNS